MPEFVRRCRGDKAALGNAVLEETGIAMRWILTIATLCVITGLGWFWWSGGFDQLARFAASEQRAFQNQMASILRDLRAGQAGAFWLLMSASFAYGFFHAVGPGHGKVLIGGYGMGRQVAALRLSVLGFLASIGQAVTAIVLVYTGVWILNLTRQMMIGVTEEVMAPASYGAIALVGLWLAWRGLRKLWPRADHHPHDHHHGHDHHHDHHHGHDLHHDHDGSETCAHCGHKHAPSLEEVSQISSLKEALILVGGIAIRPCTGALFILIITWQMGIGATGVAAAFAMALGTASVTVGVALAAVGLRGGMLSAVSGAAAARVVPVVELLAGGVITIIAGGLLLRALG